MNNRFTGPDASRRAALTSGYAQAEYKIAPSWTTYGRLEATGARANDPYLALFPEFPKLRQMAGVRLDLPYKQAVKLEFARERRFDRSQFNQIDLQWSAVFP